MSDETNARIEQIIADDYDDLCEEFRFDARVMALSGLSKCESPIERLLGSAMAFGLPRALGGLHARSWPPFWRDDGASFVHIEPQKEIEGYRADFAVTCQETVATNIVAVVRVVVECDGHDFHDKKPWQAARDKARDRKLTTAGWSVLRFTGGEIVKDPRECVSQIADAIVAEKNRQLAHHLALEAAQ